MGGETSSSPPAAAAGPTVLAPGFRFHPTDEELVWYYLRRKVSAKPLRLDVISEIDIYKFEPTDLPGLSLLKSRDREWYFFTALDRKYGNSLRTNRATHLGYWKTTGKDRPVFHSHRPVAMKKTLVYHLGRAPHGNRTDWVMHEYKLLHHVLPIPPCPLQGYVLCRIFHKTGSGPKNGEQYGAKFVEEEWQDDDPINAASPAASVLFQDPYADDADADAFIDQTDFLQVVHPLLPQSGPFPDNRVSQNCVEGCRDKTGADDTPSVGGKEYDRGSHASDNQVICDLIDGDSSTSVVKNEYMNAPTDEFYKIPFSLDELFPNDVGSALFDDGPYFDAADWDSAQLGSILDDDVDITGYLNFDCPEQIDARADLGFSAEQNVDDTFWQTPSSELLPGSSNDCIGCSSNQVMDVPIDKQPKTALSKANRWLGNIPAQQAFASEMPSKDMVSQLSAVLQSYSSAQVTAGMIRIRDMHMPFGARGSELQWSFDKTGNVNVLLSFDVPPTMSPAELESLSGIFSGKFAAATSRAWIYLMCFWVFVLALSMKLGTCIYAK